MDYCLKNGKIINPNGKYSGIGDVLIKNGKIAAIGEDISADSAEIIDASGKYIFPGLIDMHSHLREPGREDEETIVTGTLAAARGGFTAVACMANTTPVADNAYIVQYVKNKAQSEGSAKVYPIGAITKGLKGEELAELGEMYKAGAVAFSDDGKTLMNSIVMRSALEYTKMFDCPILLHQEDPLLAAGGSMHEGYWSTVLGIPGIPTVAETAVIARDLEIAEYSESQVHFCHVSTKRGVELIRDAKKRGVRVTAEATPHHLTLTDEAIQSFDTDFRVSPPLRSKSDVEALIDGVADGTIDVIATDHAPHTLEEKHCEFAKAPTGMIGFETALSVIWTELVQNGKLTAEQVVERMSVNPAKILKVEGGCLAEGNAADIIIFDPELSWEVIPEQLASKSKNTPYKGRTLQGKVVATWVDGKKVFSI